MDAKIIAIWNQSCLRAGEQCRACEDRKLSQSYPLYDVTLYLYTEPRQVVSYARALFRRSRKSEHRDNGVYLRAVARNLIRGLDFPDDLDGLETVNLYGSPVPITPDDCVRLDR